MHNVQLSMLFNQYKPLGFLFSITNILLFLKCFVSNQLKNITCYAIVTIRHTRFHNNQISYTMLLKYYIIALKKKLTVQQA
jgi:hypothetical protein